MKVIGFLLCLSIFIISCKAQQVLALKSSWDNAPQSSYLKDLDNDLNQYEGTWASFDNGKHIKLIIIKELQKQFKDMNKTLYKDQLLIRFEITDVNGLIIKSTLYDNFAINQNYQITSLFPTANNNEVILLYNGGRCSIGLGGIYMKKISATQIQWNYRPEGTVLNDQSCPPPVDTKIYLPTTENLIFTKQ